MKVVEVVEARFRVDPYFHAIAFLVQSSVLSSDLLLQILVAPQKYSVLDFPFAGFMFCVLGDFRKAFKVSQLLL